MTWEWGLVGLAAVLAVWNAFVWWRWRRRVIHLLQRILRQQREHE